MTIGEFIGYKRPRRRWNASQLIRSVARKKTAVEFTERAQRKQGEGKEKAKRTGKENAKRTEETQRAPKERRTTVYWH